MKLLTFDPGEHVGYALFNDEQCAASGMEYFRDINKLLDLCMQWHPDVVVAERVVPWGLGVLSLNITGVMHTIENNFFGHEHFHWIKASQWKPLIRNRRELLAPHVQRIGRKMTTHEGDAICIGIFVLRFKKGWLT